MRGLWLLTLLALFRLPTVWGKTEYWYVLTDIHYDSDYHNGAPDRCWLGTETGLKCCRWYDIPLKTSQKASKWGSYDCDTPLKLTEYALNLTRSQLFPRYPPSRLLWLGDNVDHHDLLQSVSHNLGEIQSMTQVILRIFEGVPMVPVIGNHDTYPIDQLWAPLRGSSWLTRALWKKWGPYLPPDQKTNFLQGGYFELQVAPHFRLLVLNSLYGEKDNLFIKKKPDPAGQDRWLASRLAEAERQGDQVWIVGHIPPGTGEADPQYQEHLLNLICTYRKTVSGAIWGHVHIDYYNLIYDAQHQLCTYSMEVPSFLPDRHDPGIRILEMDTETSELINFHQYYLNLTRQWNSGEEQWEKLYSARESYQLPDLSPPSWEKLSQEMRTNQSRFEQYWNHYYVGTPHPCNTDCRTQTLNAISLTS